TGHGSSQRPVMEGAGRAAGDACAFAIANPDKASCIYAVKPIFRSTMSNAPLLDHLAPLAQAKVPLLVVAGSLDPALEQNARLLENRYKDLGGPLELIIKEGEGHFIQPLDPKPLVNFIIQKSAITP